MNLAQVIEALPLRVYVRRGELVIHSSTPADLINRLPGSLALTARWPRLHRPESRWHGLPVRIHQRKTAARIESLAGFGGRLGGVEAQWAGVPQDEEVPGFSGCINKLP